MARSEYSRLRGIAQKRLERLTAKGLAPAGISFPKVSELKTKAAREKALKHIQNFIESGTTLTEVKKSKQKKQVIVVNDSPVLLTEKAIKELERRERRNARRRARYAVTKNLTKAQKALLKGAKTLGLNIPTDKIKSFIEYMEMRFSQVQESQFYAMAKYTEDFETILKKSPEKDDIVADFNRYVSNMDGKENLFNVLPSYGENVVNDIWSNYVKSL